MPPISSCKRFLKSPERKAIPAPRNCFPLFCFYSYCTARASACQYEIVNDFRLFFLLNKKNLLLAIELEVIEAAPGARPGLHGNADRTGAVFDLDVLNLERMPLIPLRILDICRLHRAACLRKKPVLRLAAAALRRDGERILAVLEPREPLADLELRCGSSS